MIHEVSLMKRLESGDVLICCSCGWRPKDFLPEHEAATVGDEHLNDASSCRLNNGPKPTLKSLVKYYRECASNSVYSVKERLMWEGMAEEIERQLGINDGPVEGQEPLF